MNNINYIINLLLKDNNVSAKVKNLQVNLSSLDNSVNKVSQTVNAVSADISNNITEVNTSIKGVSSVVAQTTNNINKQLNAISFGAMLDIVRNVSDAFKTLAGAEIGTGFEQSMADLSSITGIVGKELEDLGRAARETGKSSGLGAKGAADAFALLASQIQVDTIGMEGLKTLQKETITLAQAAGMGMADAATAMAATINQFGLEATDANRVINVLAAGSKYGAAEITDLAQSFKVTGAVAAAAGLSVEQSAGAIEVLSKSNLKGAEAGTALRNIIVKMQTALGMDLGETGLATALEALRPRLDDVTWLAKTFGAENLAAAQFLITNASAVDEMTTAVTGTSVAQEQAAIRTNTTEERMRRMRAAIDDLKIGFFEVTGGASAYISTIGEGAVMIAQMLPLLGGLKTVIMAVANAENLRAIATATSNAVSAVTMNGGLALGIVLSMLKTRVLALAKALTLQNIASKAAAIGTAALNLVMNMNPIALVVTAIGALVAGLIAAYNHCEGFRKVVDKAWEGIKALASAIWDRLVGAFNSLRGAIEGAWGKLRILLGLQDDTGDAAGKTGEAIKDLAAEQKEATAVVAGQSGTLKKNIDTLNSLERQIESLKTAQKDVPLEQAVILQKEIDLLEKKLATMRKVIAGEKETKQLNLDTLGGVEQKISDLQVRQKAAMGEQAVALEKEIRLWQEKERLMRDALTIGAARKPDMTPLEAPGNKGIDLGAAKATNPRVGKTGKPEVADSGPLQKIAGTIDKARDKIVSFNESIFGANSVIAGWADNATSGVTRVTSIFKEFGDMLRDNTLTSVERVSGGLAAMGALVGAMGSMVDGAAGSWLQWGANILGMVAAALPQLLALFGVQCSLAVSNSASSLPPPFNIIAIAATVAGIAAAVASIPKPKAFASGGIVYNSTFAQVGEYPGAANNPEVIAPLSKLRQLIQPVNVGGGVYEFRLRGRDLVAVAAKYDNLNTRTR